MPEKRLYAVTTRNGDTYYTRARSERVAARTVLRGIDRRYTKNRLAVRVRLAVQYA